MSDLEDELLKRFNALRAPSTDPTWSGPITAEPADTVRRAAENALNEDDELDAIANGRPLPSVSILLPPGSRRNRNEDDSLARRMRDLRGETHQEAEAADLGDDEVSIVILLI